MAKKRNKTPFQKKMLLLTLTFRKKLKSYKNSILRTTSIFKTYIFVLIKQNDLKKIDK